MNAAPCKECGVEIPSDADSVVSGFCPACTARSALQLALSVQAMTGAGPGSASQISPESFGDYDILSKIGQGGMGVVYKARQRSVNRIVALKMIRSGLWASESDVQRFRVEAEAAARLQHPNIAAVYEAGECDHQLYYTMEYFEGDDLQDRFDGEPCLPSEAVRIVQKIAEAVDHAHQRGVLHRDLKPANILLDENDEPQITDFGLALITGAGSGLTMTNTILGSPNYLAPEQTDGTKGSASALSDIYSLGAILYYLLAAKPPFQALSAVETIKKVALEEPSPPSLGNRQIPRDLDTICLKCLEKEPGKRYSSARDVAEELGRFLRKQPIQARPIGNAERIVRWCCRKPALASALAGAVGLLVIGVSGVTWQWRKALASEERAATSERDARRDARAFRREAYSSNMLLAHQNYKMAQMRLFKEMLLDGLPRPGQEDLRGFEWTYLYSLCHRDTRTIRSSLMYVKEALPSPDGSLLAALGHQGYRGGGDSQEVDRMIEFWEPVTGKKLSPIQGDETTTFTCFAFSPDGKTLAAGNLEDIEIWEVEKRRRIKILYRHEDWVQSLAFSPNGRQLASGGWDQTVRIWDLSNEHPKVVQELSAETKCVLGLDFSPDGETLAGVGYDGFIRLWNPHSGKTLRDLGEAGGDWVKAVDFHPDAAKPTLVSAGGNGSIKLWNFETGELLKTLQGHRADVYGVEFSPDQDGRYLVSAGWDNTVRLWDSETGEQMHARHGHEGHVRSAHFLPNGVQIASSSKDGTIKLWEIEKSAVTRTIRPPLREPRNVNSVKFSEDGSLLLSITGRRAKVWNVASGECVFTEDEGFHQKEEISPDLKRMPDGVTDGKLHSFNAGRGNQIPTYYGTPVFSPDGMRVWTKHKNYQRQLWNLDGQAVGLGENRTIVFSPNGRLFATSRPNKAAFVLYDAETMEEQFTLKSNDGGLTICLAFSPDSSRIVTGGHRLVQLWDAQTGRPLLNLNNLINMDVDSVAFSPNGRSLAIGGADGSITLLEPEAEEEIKQWIKKDLANP